MTDEDLQCGFGLYIEDEFISAPQERCPFPGTQLLVLDAGTENEFPVRLCAGHMRRLEERGAFE